MTFTINVPVFPMRKEIEARRGRSNASLNGAASARQRSRDAEGFLELELLPLDQLDRVESARSRQRRGMHGPLAGRN
ncbi:MAG: hypothetical protein B7X99_01150 [Rhizobiales bacterium 17-65-6]|nr:MAG: hypothetical protein B7Z30_11000 [Rhizobiales bacterium 12-68-15]OYX86959.1 MAG: hypothetical protein B7Y84_13110 [Azorhizobium sp. 32-67-21]OYY13006.1 MAG: hypothetical protein B7Y70_03580 [Rhizobiales bacterium 35-68-8]OZA01293.1 MAG: hypothetical protein B7X99_01150 [Rhizobiales bacterium 17-65-6]